VAVNHVLLETHLSGRSLTNKNTGKRTEAEKWFESHGDVVGPQGSWYETVEVAEKRLEPPGDVVE